MLYKVTLKPIGKFYFGGENSFGEAKSKNETALGSNYFAKRSAYFAKGEKFPQQTQVLGMIRKEIMRHKECLKIHNNGECVVKGKKEKAIELVGLNWKEDLGKIVQLSPIFLENNHEIFIPAPLDKDLELATKSGVSFINGRKDESSVYAFRTSKDTMFNAKDSLCSDYISSNSSIELDKIFEGVTRIGNQTLKYSDDDEEQLYKMTSYTLDKAYHFVCYLELSEDIFDRDNGYKGIVELGGERSSFQLEITSTDQSPNCKTIYKKHPKDHSRIILTSDSYVNEDIFNHVVVALSEKVNFRTIVSSQKGFSKSSNIVLLKKGSVFYVKDNHEEEIISLLDSEKAFSKIGYNQYIKLDSTKDK